DEARLPVHERNPDRGRVARAWRLVDGEMRASHVRLTFLQKFERLDAGTIDPGEASGAMGRVEAIREYAESRRAAHHEEILAQCGERAQRLDQRLLATAARLFPEDEPVGGVMTRHRKRMCDPAFGGQHQRGAPRAQSGARLHDLGLQVRSLRIGPEEVFDGGLEGACNAECDGDRGIYLAALDGAETL